MSCGGTQAQFAVRRRGKVRFVRFDQKRQSLTRFVAAPFSHKTSRTTLRFAGALCQTLFRPPGPVGVFSLREKPIRNKLYQKYCDKML